MPRLAQRVLPFGDGGVVAPKTARQVDDAHALHGEHVVRELDVNTSVGLSGAEWRNVAGSSARTCFRTREAGRYAAFFSISS